jgi:hypothetical protein
MRQWCLLILMSILGCNPTHVYVLPEGFEGPVAVVFDDPKGVPLIGGVLDIPTSTAARISVPG